jgi:hypothetical protein
MRFRGTLLFVLLAACGGNSSTPAPATKCDAPAAAVEVANEDLNGYPPYAASGCSLAYISTSGVLVLRDLATGAEETISPASDHPRHPAASADVVAWEAGSGVVGVRVRSTGETKTIDGPFVRAGEPRVSGTSVAFTAWVTDTDADVWLYDAIKGEARSVFAGPAEQRFSDVSDAYVVATDFSEDPDGKYDGAGDLADIVVFDRLTATVTKRAAEKKQAFPMLVDETHLAYLGWDLVHPEPKLQGYTLRVGAITGPPAEDVTLADVEYVTSEPVRPSTANGVIEWVANPDGQTVLWRAPADRSSAPVAVGGLEGLQLYAPVSTSAFTILASVPAGRSNVIPQLRTVAR